MDDQDIEHRAIVHGYCHRKRQSSKIGGTDITVDSGKASTNVLLNTVQIPNMLTLRKKDRVSSTKVRINMTA